MKNRIYSTLLSTAMLLSLLPMSAFAAEDPAPPEEYQTVPGGVMAYRLDYDTDVLGLFEGEWLQTTYSNDGYETYAMVNGSAAESVDDQAGTTVDGVNFRMDPKFANQGRHVQMVYTVTNGGSSEATFSLGTYTDVKIGDNDYATISELDGGAGFKMVHDDPNRGFGYGAQFNFFGRSTRGVTDVDGYCYAKYSAWDPEEFAFKTNADIDQTSGYDSGMSFCWLDRTIAPGETQIFTVLLGVGGAGSENIDGPVSDGDEEPPVSNVSGSVGGVTSTLGKQETVGTTTTVTLDQRTLSEQVQKAAAGSSVIIPVSGKADTAKILLAAQDLADLAQKEMTLEIRSGGVTYQLGAGAVDLAALQEMVGDGGSLDQISISIQLGKSDSRTALSVQAAAQRQDFSVVAPPVDLSITATYRGASFALDTFSSFVPRVMEISQEQAKQITTAIVYAPGGMIYHVPTYVYAQDGRWFAKVSTLTSSTCVLINSQQSFPDTAGAVYQSAADELASRKIITPGEDGRFHGEQTLTRAEFAALIVRAMGLPMEGCAQQSDIPADSWYSPAVATATRFGLMSGMGDGRFQPLRPISRQEAISVLYQAAQRAGQPTGTQGSATFSDYDAVASWAKTAMDFAISNQLLGADSGKLRPTEEITRGEAAVLMLRMLQQSGLVDVRS